jgi:hypothetical protein
LPYGKIVPTLKALVKGKQIKGNYFKRLVVFKKKLFSTKKAIGAPGNGSDQTLGPVVPPHASSMYGNY